MKVLLINPPIFNIIDPSLPEVLLAEEDPMPPLGLMYLAGYLEKHSQHEVKILDAQIEKLNFDDIKKYMNEYQPDVVGITAMTFTLLDVMATVKAVRAVKPKIKIVLGGPHVHIYAEETINLPGVDYLILGEGEKSFKNLLDKLAKGQQLDEIKNLVYKRNGQIIKTGMSDLAADLDDLPFPARHLLPYKKYISSLAKEFPITTMFTSRGCPYKCLFCDRPHLGKNFRARSAKNVVDEMQQCQDMGIKEVFIYDDTFGIDRQRVLDICALIKQRGIKISWDIRTRVNTVDAEVLTALKQAGCSRIHYGVEAGTQKILNVLRKGITLPMAQKAFQLTHQAGIQTLGYFMLGSPTETRQDILQTIQLAKDLKPDFAHFTLTTPYPATDLYRLGLENGIIKKDYWQEFSRYPQKEFEALVWQENFTKQELVELLKKAYREFYFRPSYIWQRLKQISSFKELMTKTLMAFKMLRV